MNFKIESNALDSGVQVLTISGEMRLGKESQQLESVVHALLQRGQNRIVVEMSGVRYVDSSAVGILVACHSSVAKSGGQFYLTGVVPRVATIFRMTGVDRILKIHDTAQQACAAFAATA